MLKFTDHNEIAASSKPSFDKGRVLGYMTKSYATGTETLYAVAEDGTAKMTREIERPNPYFNGHEFLPCDKVPDHAEFIGFYEAV